ncbi:LUD domain-containing protein, partial [Campylobacter jejuni]|uniref:LUD domain-containing protein n=1 Tax=Campylobacter jejuni TaxID=197 RepID=UPI0007083137
MSKIDEISSKSKANILEHLKKAYKETTFTRIESIDPVEHIQTTQDMLTEMKQKMSDNKYIVENATKDTLEEKINEIVAKYGFKSMIYGADLNLNLEQIKAEKNIPSSKTQPRMLSLAPKLCIVLLKKENVVKSLSEALNLVK